MLGVLHTHHVEFILTGGVAARVHGSVRATHDVDIVYARSNENIARVVKALAPFNPYPNDAPAHLPFAWTAKTVKAGLNFPLQTTLGELDLHGEVVGGGRYEDLAGHCVNERLSGHATMVVSLAWLIQLKRAAGYARDFAAIAELEILRDLATAAEA